jgi:subtilisin family serine protease
MTESKADPMLLAAMLMAEPPAAPPVPAPAGAEGGIEPTLIAADLLRSASHMGLVTVSVDSPKPARAVVFIESEQMADVEAIAARHPAMEINAGTGPVRTAIVPLDVLPELTEHDAVRRVQLSRRLKPSLDRASATTKLLAFRVAHGTLTGKGVLIGIIDTGVDPHHPAFGNRILRIWDQTLPGPGVPEGGYGVELTGPMIQVSRDTEGHGTHVGGISAGNDPLFGGVAPEAELVYVKTTFQDAHIADGLRYLARVAKSLKRPIVINMSLGGHFDAHDGTDMLSMVVDSLPKTGCVVCIAAGNEGDDAIHAAGSVQPAKQLAVPFVVTANRAGVLLNGWYDGNQAFEVMISAPFKSTPWFGPGPGAAKFTLPDGVVTIAAAAPDPANGDRQVVVRIDPPVGRAITAGHWRLRIRAVGQSTGRFDVWMLDLTDGPGEPPVFAAPTAEDSMKVGSPGAASNAITVASYATRVAWRSQVGDVSVNAPIDMISSFSSEGPRRDAAKKPDVAAPGQLIISARSADAQFMPKLCIDAAHVVMQGTSMACPFVTGLAALLLQQNPKLTATQVKKRLIDACAQPDGSKRVFDPKWGYGLIDASAIVI